jgi:CDP-diacylglycerol---serine O-phosphatidyltransferase
MPILQYLRSRENKRLVVPGLITSIAILVGYLSILETLQGKIITAATLILLACLLDMFDGRIARMIRATSEFGEQFDSLADIINFGMAPALLLYFAYFKDWGWGGVLLSFLPVCCAGIRLARFNVTADPDIPTRYFVGLPTTMAALVLAGFVLFADRIASTDDLPFLAALLTVTVALLMVSNVQYEKGNILSLRYIRKTRRFITGLVVIVSLVLFPQEAFLGWGLLYIMYGVVRSAGRTFFYGDDTAIEAEIDDI